MAVRTDSTKVGKLIKISASVDPAFAIEAASYLVDKVCAIATLPDSTEPYYSATDLELIERWLAAHFYAVRESRARSQQVSTLRQDLQSKVDLGLNVTHYGQQAMRLDVNGGLAALNANATKGRRKLTGGVKWLGTLPENEPELES